MKTLSKPIAVAALSGFLSYVACLLVESGGTDWGAGLLFGVLVLAPSAKGAVRRLALVGSSMVVYRGAVELAVELYGDRSWPSLAACGLAGILGAVALPLAASVILWQRPQGRPIALGALVGAVSGLVFGVGLQLPDAFLHVTYPLGFATWQVGYAMVHRLPGWFGADKHLAGSDFRGTEE